MVVNSRFRVVMLHSLCLILLTADQGSLVSAKSKSHLRSKPAVTSCGKAFCEQSTIYPVSSNSQKSLENDPKLAFLKGSSPTKGSSAMADDDPELPNQTPQLQLCLSKTDIIYPQEAENTRGQRRFIINFGPFSQGLTIERCTVDNFRLPCNYVGVPPGYQSICVQKESEHRLTTIENDAAGQVQTSVDIFRFPSSCSCRIIPATMASSITASRCTPDAVPLPGPLPVAGPSTGSFFGPSPTAVIQPLTGPSYTPPSTSYGGGLASNAGYMGAGYGGHGQMGYDAPVTGSGATDSLTGRSRDLFGGLGDDKFRAPRGNAATRATLPGFPSSSGRYSDFYIQ